MRRVAVAATLLAACGRYGFDATNAIDANDAVVDVAPPTCGTRPISFVPASGRVTVSHASLVGIARVTISAQ